MDQARRFHPFSGKPTLNLLAQTETARRESSLRVKVKSYRSSCLPVAHSAKLIEEDGTIIQAHVVHNPVDPHLILTMWGRR